MMALVVDDSAAMRRIQQKALETLGWTVRTAGNGSEAIDVLATIGTCDLVLTDWHMPGMDGLELVKAIRKEPKYQKVRILMVTSESVLGAVDEALSAGADDLVMKPFSTDALAERSLARDAPSGQVSLVGAHTAVTLTSPPENDGRQK